MKNLVHSLFVLLLLSPAVVEADDFEISDLHAGVFPKTADGKEILDFLANFTVRSEGFSGGIKLSGHAKVGANGQLRFQVNDFCPEDTNGRPQICIWIKNITNFSNSTDVSKFQDYLSQQRPEKLAQLDWFCGQVGSHYDHLLNLIADYANDPSNIEDRVLAKQIPVFYEAMRGEYETLGVQCQKSIAKITSSESPSQEVAVSSGELDNLKNALALLQAELKNSNQTISSMTDELEAISEQLKTKQDDLDEIRTLLATLETNTTTGHQSKSEVDQQLANIKELLAAQDLKLQNIANIQNEGALTMSKLASQYELLSGDLNRVIADVARLKRDITKENIAVSTPVAEVDESIRQDLRNLQEEMAELKAQLSLVQNAPAATQPLPEKSEFSAYRDSELQFEIIDDARSFAQVKDLRNDPVALWRLGTILARGIGVDRDFEQGIAALVKSAELGYVLSQNELASLYHNGNYFDRDFAKAHYWYDRAGQQGYGKAIANLAGMYAVGQHKPRSLEKSLELREIALEKGHAPSALRLGEEYFYGNPVFAPNCVKGKEYLIRAVKLGVPESGKKLIKAYSHAVGTRAISPCADDMGATMESMDEVKKFVIFNGQVELNARVLSPYHGLGVDPLNRNKGVGSGKDVFSKFTHDEILEMTVFLFAEIEHIHQLGGKYAFSTGDVPPIFRAKFLLNRLILENCGWVDNPLMDRKVLDFFDYNGILGKSDYKEYRPKLTSEMQGFCKRAIRLLDQRVQLSESKNHADYYGLLEPRDILVHLNEYIAEPEL